MYESPSILLEQTKYRPAICLQCGKEYHKDDESGYCSSGCLDASENNQNGAGK